MYIINTVYDSYYRAGEIIGYIIVIAVIVWIATRIRKSLTSKRPPQQPPQPQYRPPQQPVQPQPAQPVMPASATDKIGVVIGVTGYFQGKSFRMDSQLRLGRDGSCCNIIYPVNIPGISSTHCVVTYKNNAVYVTDLGSSYGTFLENGVRLIQNVPTKLNNGDKFYLANNSNMFEVRYY